MSHLYCLLFVGFLGLLQTISAKAESPDGYTAVEPTDECVIEAINAVEPDIVQYFHDKHPEYNFSKIEPPYAAERKLITPHVTLYYRIHFLIEPIDSRVSVGNVTVYIEKDRIDHRTIFILDKVIVEIVEPVPPVPGTQTPKPIEITTPRAVPTTNPKVVSTTTSKAVPTTTQKAVPTTTQRAVPSTTPKAVPTINPKVVPTTTSKAVPTTTQRAVPTTTQRAVPTTTSKAVPSTTSRDVPTINPKAFPTINPKTVPTTTSPTIQPVLIPGIRVDPIGRDGKDAELAFYFASMLKMENLIRERNSVSHSIMPPFLAAQQALPEGMHYYIAFDGIPLDPKIVPNETFLAHIFLPNDGFTQVESVELYDPHTIRFPSYPKSLSATTEIGTENVPAGFWTNVDPAREDVLLAFNATKSKFLMSRLDIYECGHTLPPFLAQHMSDITKPNEPEAMHFQVAFTVTSCVKEVPNYNFTAVIARNLRNSHYDAPVVSYYRPESFEHPLP